ncbi:MAG: peptidylprolyl isomerase, partial [Chloroflexota bacterium]
MTVTHRRRAVRLVAILSAAGLLAACGATQAPTGDPTGDPVGGSDGCPSSQPDQLAAGESRTVTITTDLGQIAVLVEADLSPIATGNFVALAGCGFYDGVVFHRVVP